MRPHQALAAATCALALCLAATCQGRATVIVDRGKGAANPAVETGGHPVPPGTPRPAIDIILMDTSWLAPFSACPWGLFGSVLLSRHHVPAKAKVRLHDDHIDRPARPLR